MNDEDYMKHAIELAKKGVGFVNPNPMVGAVIVKEDRIIGEGYHKKYGELHAERNAFANLTEPAEGATLYVTLEPCCHYGKTPPCTEAIIEHKIGRVVIGSKDPNPLVAGKGVQILKEHGISVTENVCREACDELNPVFFHYIRTKMPYVAMKFAETLDGKIACESGASKWVTGEEARTYVMKLRHRYMGIMVGVQTVLTDDPMLNCRMEGGRNPVRIICDTHLRTPLMSKIVLTAKEIPTILATAETEESKHHPYREMGCEVVTVDAKDGKLNLKELMIKLGERKIDSILLEGGATLNWSALKNGIVNYVYGFIAPKFFGGEKAKTPVAGEGFATPEEAIFLKNKHVRNIGEDILIEGEVKSCLPEL